MSSSSTNTSASTNGGIGFAGALTIAFIVLKLTHVIGWSWWWVLSPLWIGAALGAVVLTVFAFIFLLAMAIDAWKDRRRALKRTRR